MVGKQENPKAPLPKYNDKHCPQCDMVKPVTDFYKCGEYYQKRCKGCHNAYRKQFPQKPVTQRKKRVNEHSREKRFTDLSEEMQNKINELIKTKYIKNIAKETGVSATYLYKWQKQGVIGKREKKPASPYKLSFKNQPEEIKKFIIDTLKEKNIDETIIELKPKMPELDVKKLMYQWRNQGYFIDVLPVEALPVEAEET